MKKKKQEIVLKYDRNKGNSFKVLFFVFFCFYSAPWWVSSGADYLPTSAELVIGERLVKGSRCRSPTSHLLELKLLSSRDTGLVQIGGV